MKLVAISVGGPREMEWHGRTVRTSIFKTPIEGRVHAGRENLFEFDPQPIEGIKQYLDFVSEQWDHALSRLKSFVEE